MTPTDEFKPHVTFYTAGNGMIGMAPIESRNITKLEIPANAIGFNLSDNGPDYAKNHQLFGIVDDGLSPEQLHIAAKEIDILLPGVIAIIERTSRKMVWNKQLQRGHTGAPRFECGLA